MACEYGPIAFGALSVATTSEFICMPAQPARASSSTAAGSRTSGIGVDLGILGCSRGW